MKQTIKRERSHFSQITNELLGDKNLSLKAKGLYAFMYSKDDDWNFTIKSMSKQLKEGVDSIQSGLRELKNNGWLKYTKKSDGTGEYFLFIHPQKTERKIPNRENPNQDNPNLGKSTRISNIDYTSNTNKENNKKKFIVPTVEEITQYCKERNNSVNPQKFYDFYESKGWMVGKNKMKNWKAAVRTWETPKQSEDRPMEINGRKIAFYTEDGQPVFKKALR